MTMTVIMRASRTIMRWRKRTRTTMRMLTLMS